MTIKHLSKGSESYLESDKVNYTSRLLKFFKPLIDDSVSLTNTHKPCMMNDHLKTAIHTIIVQAEFFPVILNTEASVGCTTSEFEGVMFLNEMMDSIPSMSTIKIWNESRTV